MLYIEIFYCFDSSKAFNLAVNAVKCSGCFKLRFPGIFIIASHIVVSVVTSNNHQRTKDYILESCIFNFCDNFFASCIFWFTFYSTDESVCESKVFHLCLHLVICYVSCMGCTMSHEYECCTSICCCLHIIESCFLASCICDCLSNCFLVIVNYCSVIAYFTKHWLCDCNRFEFIFVFVNSIYHLIILCTMHQMCRLYNKVLNTVIYCTVKCLLHVIDCFIISCFYMVDDDLCCECTSYRPVRICFCKSIFNSFDILCTAIVEGCTKAYYQNFVLTDFVLVTWIIFGSITCITSKILWACFFTFNQFFLSICQFVPCFFCCFAVFISCVISFLNIDLVDQGCYFVSCFLIIIRSFCCIIGSVLCFCSICCFCVIS